MKHRFKSLLMGIGIMCLTYSMTQAATLNLLYDGEIHYYDLPPISIYIDNKLLDIPVMPAVQIDDHVLVPAKEVIEAMGAIIEWKESEKSVYIHDEFSLIVLKINNKEVWVNGEVEELEISPKIINDKTMIPLRFISETMGFDIVWENEARNVYINHVVASQENLLSEASELLPEEILPEISEEEQNRLVPPQTPLVPEYILGDQDEQVEKLLNGILYDTKKEELIVEKPPFFQLSDIIITDNYRQRNVVIDLQNDYSTIFNDVLLGPKGGTIKQLSVQTDKSTKIIVDTKVIQAINLYEDDQKIHIQFVAPRQKYEKIIVIDPGHGGSAPGTSGGGVKEKDNTLKYGTDFYYLLESNPDIKVYATRQEDVDVSLEERAQIANEINPDLFISIHNNSIEGDDQVKERVKGTETYYYDKPDDLRARNFAAIVQERIVETLNMTDRKIKPDTGYIVLKRTTMPGVLIEVGFLSNIEDREKMMQPGFSQDLAEVLYQAVLTYFENGENIL